VAKELYERAANCFKLGKNCKDNINILVALASEAYLKVAECEVDEGVAASSYVEAANCIKRVNISEAVKIMERAIECYCNTGNIRMVRL